jgi:hypothetical protein
MQTNNVIQYAFIQQLIIQKLMIHLLVSLNHIQFFSSTKLKI